MLYLRFLSTMAQDPQPDPERNRCRISAVGDFGPADEVPHCHARLVQASPWHTAIRDRPSRWHHCHNSTTINRNPA